MPRHLIMCCGARVEIMGSEVRVLDDPLTKQCPLMTLSLPDYKLIDREAVRRKIISRMERLGFASKDRAFITEPLVPFGASEILMSCLEEGIFDCAITVCEGAGTVISPNPKLVQMIGAFLTGIIETTPIPEIISVLKQHGGIVVDEDKALIDQAKGVEVAAQRGFKRIAVTVAGFKSLEIPRIRDLERALNVEVTIMSVCNTRAAERDVENLMLADLVWACNSRIVREKIAPHAIFQLGISIPVFALTNRGKKALLTHLMKMQNPIVAFRAKMPYLVPEKLPQ